MGLFERLNLGGKEQAIPGTPDTEITSKDVEGTSIDAEINRIRGLLTDIKNGRPVNADPAFLEAKLANLEKERSNSEQL